MSHVTRRGLFAALTGVMAVDKAVKVKPYSPAMAPQCYPPSLVKYSAPAWEVDVTTHSPRLWEVQCHSPLIWSTSRKSVKP